MTKPDQNGVQNDPNMKHVKKILNCNKWMNVYFKHFKAFAKFCSLTKNYVAYFKTLYVTKTVMSLIGQNK